MRWGTRSSVLKTFIMGPALDNPKRRPAYAQQLTPHWRHIILGLPARATKTRLDKTPPARRSHWGGLRLCTDSADTRRTRAYLAGSAICPVRRNTHPL